ncbi:MAG: guanylate kinase [Enterobacterales bacterium]
MSKGILFIISAPSGAGKSSLISKLLTQYKYNKNIKTSISYTTRNIRPKEINGNHYFFVSVLKFKYMISKNKFLEYEKVFGNYYGTPRLFIEKSLKMGFDVLLNIDWRGANTIRKKIKNNICSIFILPPSIEELNKRLYKRDQYNEQNLNERITYSSLEMKHYHEYDYLIINDNFYKSLNDLKSIINAVKLTINYQKINNIHLINNLF